jgi:hypothetical protein
MQRGEAWLDTLRALDSECAKTSQALKVAAVERQFDAKERFRPWEAGGVDE